MKCRGCGDDNVTIINHSPLCGGCAKNSRGAGEFGDWDDELALESLSLELLETDSVAPEATGIQDLFGTPDGFFDGGDTVYRL